MWHVCYSAPMVFSFPGSFKLSNCSIIAPVGTPTSDQQSCRLSQFFFFLTKFTTFRWQSHGLLPLWPGLQTSVILILTQSSSNYLWINASHSIVCLCSPSRDLEWLFWITLLSFVLVFCGEDSFSSSYICVFYSTYTAPSLSCTPSSPLFPKR